MTKKVFIDTGALIALLEGESEVSLRVFDLLKKVANEGGKFFTSDYVLDELLTWMRCKKKFDMKRVLKFINSVHVSEIEVFGVTQDLFGDALKLMDKYDDQYFSFTDCLSFAAMKELKTKDVIALDKHFVIAGFNNLLKIN
jgi:uncharacterized protein